MQIDVKVVPDYCIRGKLRRDEKRLYQWTAIDECTRIRYLYIFEEHTPENSVIFLKKFLKWFPFEVKCIQTDNGTEFTYKFISDETKCPFEAKLAELGIEHRLIKPRHRGTTEKWNEVIEWTKDISMIGNISEKQKKQIKSWQNT